MVSKKQGQGVDVGGAGGCAELPEGLRGVVEERLEAWARWAGHC